MLVNKIIKSLFFKFGSKSNENEVPIIIYNDWIGKNVIYDGFYEKELVETIISSLNFDTKNNLCVDVGANIGNHTLQFSKKFKKILAFEPQIKTFKILELNTLHINNIEVYNFGLSNEEKTISFKIPFNNNGAASQNFNGTAFYTEKVALKNYDSLFKNEVSYLKIDVEGNEIDVLQSMTKNIKLHKPVISFEMNSTVEERKKIVELFNELGYKKYYVQNNHFIERVIPVKTVFTSIFKFLIKRITPSPKKKLVLIDPIKLINTHKTYSLVTTYNEESVYKLNSV